MKPMMKGKGAQYKQDIVALRCFLHGPPELCREDHETSKEIQEKLEEHSLHFALYATTGLLGVIEGSKPGRTVALRAGRDALPIEEKNDQGFISKIEEGHTRL